tara:strand:+ start:2030 stop:3103 length:1074 start_codon:yes stop_codon:yes gene_type:complete
MLKFIKKNIIKQNIAIENAINKMEISEKKILLVISRKNKFIGTVTDGDFRRFFLMKNRNLKSPISSIANKNSIFLRNSEILKENKIKNLFLTKLVNYIPILNDKNYPIGILDRDDYVGLENKYNLPIIIMAGGFGKRLGLITKNIPKPTVQINGIPMINKLIENLYKDNFKNFFISLFYKGNLIKNAIKKNFKINNSTNINYYSEKKPLGTAGSIFKIISQHNLSGPIMVLNSDIMTNINYQDVYDYYKKNKTDHLVCVKEIKTAIPYGVCKIKNKQLVKIEEKIELSNYINAGIYIFNSSKLKKMKHSSKIDMDELLKKLISKRNKIITFPINEFWTDLGTPSNINRARIIDALTI